MMWRRQRPSDVKLPLLASQVRECAQFFFQFQFTAIEKRQRVIVETLTPVTLLLNELKTKRRGASIIQGRGVMVCWWPQEKLAYQAAAGRNNKLGDEHYCLSDL